MHICILMVCCPIVGIKKLLVFPWQCNKCLPDKSNVIDSKYTNFVLMISLKKVLATLHLCEQQRQERLLDFLG